MSHFLERLASGVTQRGAAAQPALRPMVGSIYAPQRSRDAEQSTAVHEEETAERAVSDARRETSREREPSILSRGRGAISAEEPEAVAQGTPAHTQPAAERLLPAAREEVHANAGTLRGDAVRGDDAELPKPREERTKPLDLRTAIDLLMQPSWSDATLPVPAAHSAARAGREETARRGLQPQREPDEITINIGRIEVAAVQQIVRPAAAPARKAMSLDEYLKRGSGRAR